MLAGPFANLIFAVVVLWGFYLSNGMPIFEPVIGKVMPSSLAEQHGLQSQDRILAINNNDVDDFYSLRSLVQNHESGTDMTIVFLRADKQQTIIIPRMTNETLGFYASGAIRMSNGKPVLADMTISSAFQQAWNETLYICGAIFRFLARMLGGSGTIEELGGPVRIAEGTANAWQQGWGSLVHLLALISINLGIFNLLPIPPLDGGQIVLYLAERIGRERAEKMRLWGYQLGFLFLVTVFVFVTWNDIVRLLTDG